MNYYEIIGKMGKRNFFKILSLVDIFIIPLTFVSALLLCFVRRAGTHRMPFSRKIFMKIGVFPIIDHYYEPLFNPKYLHKSLREDRVLPGIDLNIKEQLDILSKFNYNDELLEFPLDKNEALEFYYHNDFFPPGDAEYLYNCIRLFKPRRLIEIGSGNSTLMAISAIRKNAEENSNYSCEHICIEPYEVEWLEEKGVRVIREKVENIDKNFFAQLDCNDILFIDSSHIIRPQGDVLYEYLEILPILNAGVLIHLHDVLTPKDYFEEWIIQENKFWNEQYLLEAFLTFNFKFKVVGALNFLKHNYFNELSSKCPILAKESYGEPGSFWLVKTT